ncbi:MAG TPA: nuclear transport factor 2 family protein [Actinomycetaceae bacterium]|nr:nuclear transport factor 2 family protein [Actinomycetaceae bacterium]
MTRLNDADRLAIQELNAAFAWALDDKNYDHLREILAPDVHYVSVGREFHDAEAVIASFQARTGTRTTRHGLGNLMVHADGADRARGRSTWFTFASNDDPPQGVEIYMVADFDDSYVRGDDGRWRILERIITPVFRRPELGPQS